MPLSPLNTCHETPGHNDTGVGNLMMSIGALEMMPCTWVAFIAIDALRLERALEGTLGTHDCFLVTEIGPTWVAGRTKPATAAWLKALRP